ncbi:hypothetical protein BDR22DRAFT_225246 [Usnea florida]
MSPFLRHSKMLLLALSLFCPLISTFEVTVRSADSVQERQESSVCLYYNAGSSSAWCLNNEQCQVATALTPAIIFCGTSGAIPHTTENDYNPSMVCTENCCQSNQPSAYKFELSNGDTAWWGCGTVGGITTANAIEDLITVAGTTTSTSSVETSQSSLVIASPSAAISGTSASSTSPTSPTKTPASASSAKTTTTAPSAKTSGAVKGDGSSGLSTASEIGSVIGAVFGAIAIAVAIFFGIKSLKKERQHRKNQRSRRSSDSDSERIVLNRFHQ